MSVEAREVLVIATGGKGLVEITAGVGRVVAASGLEEGMCNVFTRHTSCGLTIQENADPTAARDLEEAFERLAPEGASWYRHTLEGADDMPSHIRSVLCGVSLSIPVIGGRLGLGTWQGIWLWEHRRRPHRREVVVTAW